MSLRWLAAAAIVVGVGCSSSAPPAAPSPTVALSSPGVTRRPTPSATATRALHAGPPRLVSIGRFDQPLYVTAPAGDARVFVVEKTGRVRVVKAGRVLPTPYLDVSAEVSTGGEQGLLSIAFAPDYSTSGLVYADETNRAGDTRVLEFHVSASDPDRVDPSTRREVLGVDQPYPNHNGGLLLFDRSGALLIGLGDGGSAGDPGNRAQNLGVLLGKILRIDPHRSGSAAYRIPDDNPFLHRRRARGEVWASGLRNPWRFSLDAAGTLFVGDVGQNRIEEVDVVPPAAQSGANYGWSLLEGNERFKAGPAPSGVIDPELVYQHTSGRCSIIGGVVYTGDNASLRGRYLYGDACSGEVWAATAAGTRLGSPDKLGVAVPQLSSFGTDATGRVYAASLGGDVSRID